MFDRIASNQDPSSLASRMRRKRLAFFFSLLARLEPPIHILDVGGTEGIWRAAPVSDRRDLEITLLNRKQFSTSLPGVRSITGDARDIHFPDAHFDVVFSNSVIEHVGGFDDQQRMAMEVRRVGKRHFVQTPNRYFPVEPHFLFPLFQFFPTVIQVWLLQRFRLGWIKRTPDRAQAIELISSIRLLNKTEFEMLFPGSNIFEERIFGLTKSFVAWGGWESPPS